MSDGALTLTMTIDISGDVPASTERDQMRLLPHVRCMLGEIDCRWIGVKVEHRWVVKQLPKHDRYWNPNIRAWVTPVYVIATLPGWLEALGYEVAIVDVSRVPAPRNWHARYREVIGETCPHRKKRQKATERLATTGIEELGAAA